MYHENARPISFISNKLARETSKNKFLVSCSSLVKHLLRTDKTTVEYPFRASRQVFGKTILDSDGEDHSRIRRLLLPYFTKENADVLKTSIIIPTVERVWHDAEKYDVFEFQEEIANRIPLIVTMGLMGVSVDREVWLRKRLKPIVLYLDNTQNSLERAYESRQELEVFFRQLYREGAFIENRLCQKMYAHYQESAMSFDELVQTSVLLMAAGFETTSCALSTIFVRIFENKTFLQANKDDSFAIESFVYETLRFSPPLPETVRFSTEKISVENVEIPKGAWITLSLGEANKDKKLFPNADTWCPYKKIKKSFSFGDGRHSCIGSQIAIQQLIAFTESVIPILPHLETVESLPKNLHGKTFQKPLPFLIKWKNK